MTAFSKFPLRIWCFYKLRKILKKSPMTDLQGLMVGSEEVFLEEELLTVPFSDCFQEPLPAFCKGLLP